MTFCYLLFRYYSVIPEMRQTLNMTDPFCELFPKMAACHYHRYGMGGREDDRHAICILGTVYILGQYIHTYILASVRLCFKD